MIYENLMINLLPLIKLNKMCSLLFIVSLIKPVGLVKSVAIKPIKKITEFNNNYRIFNYSDYYLLEIDLSSYINQNISLKSSSELIIIYSKGDLEELLKEGYSIGTYFNLTGINDFFDGGMILFAIFSDKILASVGWVACKNYELEPPIKVDYNNNEVYVQYAHTDPEYRGNGFFKYNIHKRIEFLANKGKTKAKIAVEKNNTISLRSNKKVGYKIYGEAKHLQLLKYTYYKEKYYNNFKKEQLNHNIKPLFY